MYTIILLLVLCAQVVPEPRCCPCPDSSERAHAPACECDTPAAPSSLHPAALPPGPRFAAPREDSKNLLEPEVSLAASMFDTLHEATEEEYRDALARDAARDAARDVATLDALVRDVAILDALTRDAEPEESAQSVIVVVPSEPHQWDVALEPHQWDVAPESRYSDAVDEEGLLAGVRHVQESRCIHPPGSTLDNMRSSISPFQVLSDTLRVPKLKHNEFPYNNLLQLDSNVGASNADEIVVDTDGNMKSVLGKKSRLLPHSIMKSFPNDQSTDFRLHNTNTQSMETDGIDLNGGVLSLKPKLGSRVQPVVEKLGSALKNMQLAEPNENQKQVIDYDKLPLNLRNILKLRDVELIPKSIRNKSSGKPKIDLSQFAIPTIFKQNTYPINNDYEQEESPSNIDFFRLSSEDEFNDKEMETGASESVFDKINTDEETAGSNDEAIVNSLINNDVNNPLSYQSREDVFSTDADVNNQESLDSKEAGFSTIKKTLPDISVIDETFAKVACNGPLESKEIESIEDSMSNRNNDVFSNLKILEKPVSISLPQIDFTNTKSAQNHEQIVNSGDPTPIFENLPENRNTLPSIGNTLTQFRENVVKQLENLNHPLLKSELLQSQNVVGSTSNERNQEKVVDENLKSNLESDESEKVKADMESDASNIGNYHVTENDISINDLQNWSNILLNSNQKNLNEVPSTLNINENGKLSEDELRSKEVEIKKTEVPKDVEMNSCKIESDNTADHINETEKSAKDNSSVKEMNTGSSDIVINTLPGILDSLNPNLKMGYPLLDNIALQPASIDPLNLLGKPLENVLSLNTNLPTLDDIRDRLSNIFNNKEDSPEDNEDASSLETETNNDSPASRMAASATSIKAYKELPLLRQLEEFNNNIINTKSLALAPSDRLLNKQRLQLDSYKAHLPSPTTLELKPLNIQPNVNNKAKLSNPTSNFRTNRPKSLTLKPVSPTVNSWESLSSLDELRNSMCSNTNSMRSNTNNIFENLCRPQLLPIKENLRTHDIDDVAKNIRLNTEKTVKGIQRKMKSALKKPALQNPLANSLATPQDLLDDMNDKLKGLQYDLNDRLASLRESFLDSTRTKSVVDQPRKAVNRNVMKNIRKPKPKNHDTTSRLQTSSSTPLAEVIRNNEISNQPQPRNYFNKDWNQFREAQSSASETHPAKMEITKMRTDRPQSPPHWTSPTTRRYSANVENQRDDKMTSFLHRKESDDRNTKRPFKSATSSFLQSRQPKVTILFGSTPPPPPATPPAAAAGGPARVSSAADVAPSPDKFKPLRSSAPVPSSLDEDYEDTLNNFSFETIPSEEKFAVPVFTKKGNTDKKLFINDLDDRKGFFSRNFLPNKSNLAESLASSNGEPTENFRKWNQASGINTKSAGVTKSEQVDMLRSATEDKQLVVDEPLKENVSYKCRIICTKEIR